MSRARRQAGSLPSALIGLGAGLLLRGRRRRPAARSSSDPSIPHVDLRETLVTRELILRDTLEHTQTGSWEWDVVANVVRWSDNLGPIHGRPRGFQPADYEEYRSLIHPDDRARVEDAIRQALEGADGYEIELRTVPRAGEVRWIWAHASVLRDEDRNPVRIVGLTRDITARKRDDERELLLAGIAQILADPAPQPDDLVQLVADSVADVCTLEELEDGAFATRAAAGQLAAGQTGVAGALAGEEVAAGGEARLHRELDDARLDGLRSAIVAPLRTRGHVLGVLVLGARESRRRYDEDDLRLAEELARRVALALEAAQLDEAAQDARRDADLAADQATRLQELTAGLAAAATAADIADAIISLGIPALSARTGVLGVIEDGSLRFLRSTGYGGVFPDRLALDEPWPIVAAVREQRLIELRDLPQRRATFAVPEEVWAASGHGTLVAVPLVVRDRAVGALGFTREQSTRLSVSERRFVETLARQAAQALERAQLFDTERAARMHAELLEQHASRIAVAVTPHDVAAATLAELEAAGVTAARVQRLAGATVETLASSGALADALDLPLADLERLVASLGSRDALDAGDGQLLIPLRGVDGAIIGALTVATEPADGPDARRRLVAVAEQTGLALERASLYEADRRARHRAEGLQRVASAVATAATVDDVANAVASEALRALDASGVTVVLARPGNSLRGDVLASHGAVATYTTDEPEVDVGGGTITAAAMRSGAALYAETERELERSWPATAAVARSLGLGAVASVPFAVGERRGALSVVAEGPKRFSPEERTFLDLLARACEQGLIRASLYEAERHARRRSDILHELSAALSGALSAADVGTAFLEHVLGHLGAGSGALLLAEPDGRTLTAAAIGGAGASRARWLTSVPADDAYALSWAYAHAAPVRVGTHGELERRFPATARTFGDAAQAVYAGPLVAGPATLGAFGLVFEHERRLSQDDERLLATMADLCAQAIERAGLYESEHRIALRLQRALLPEAVARHADLEIAARYRAGSAVLEVGGDWFDTFALPGDRVGVAVGDVVGHGIEAAAAMGRLRSAFSAFAFEETSPGAVLSRLGRFAGRPGGVDFATTCYAVLEPSSGVVRYASAGHPPMLLLTPAGETRWLDDARSGPLMSGTVPQVVEAAVVLDPGSVLLLFSDGLVERRRELLTLGFERLEGAARALTALPVDELCDRLLDEVLAPSDQPDDVVLLAVRAGRVEPRRFHCEFPARPGELRIVRAAAKAWLRAHDLPLRSSENLMLALGEACSNAVEHAYPDIPGDVAVTMEHEGGDIVVTVRDHGRWRPPADAHDFRGWGRGIMESVSSAYEVDAQPDGTTVTLRFAAREAVAS